MTQTSAMRNETEKESSPGIQRDGGEARESNSVLGKRNSCELNGCCSDCSEGCTRSIKRERRLTENEESENLESAYEDEEEEVNVVDVSDTETSHSDRKPETRLSYQIPAYSNAPSSETQGHRIQPEFLLSSLATSTPANAAINRLQSSEPIHSDSVSEPISVEEEALDLSLKPQSSGRTKSIEATVQFLRASSTAKTPPMRLGSNEAGSNNRPSVITSKDDRIDQIEFEKSTNFKFPPSAPDVDEHFRKSLSKINAVPGAAVEDHFMRSLGYSKWKQIKQALEGIEQETSSKQT